MLTNSLAFFVVCFPSLFSIVDPFAALPAFVALTRGQSPSVQRRTAHRATLTMLAMLVLFGLTGTLVFRFFGITIPAFKIAGGVLLFLNSLDMIRAKEDARTTSSENKEAEEKDDVAIIPIGIPLLSGPGAIATTVMWSARAKHYGEKISFFACIGLVAVLTLLCLRSGARLLHALGRTGINIITRVMGLMLAATGVQFLIDGVLEAFHRAGT